MHQAGVLTCQILNHIALFSSNMFRHKNTISMQVPVQMCDKNTHCDI